MQKYVRNIKLGVSYSGYPEKRNFINLPYKNVLISKHIEVLRFFDYVNYKFSKLFNYKNQFISLSLHNFHSKLGIKNSDINHFFNGISLSNTPWFTTFETSLPRLAKDKGLIFNIGIDRLAHESCKNIFAISNCTKRIQEKILHKVDPIKRNNIMDKIIVLHPPQKLLIKKYSDKKLVNDWIVLTLIGSDFFRKGGGEVLSVINEIFEKNPEEKIKLNIISNLKVNDYASKSNSDDKNRALSIIKKHPNNICHYKQLPNFEVLSILKSTHVALLPTYADTYGYSVLEAQASGCPVITTDVRALPEINNEKCGWVIKVPKNELGDALYQTVNERKILSETIRSGLINILKEIKSNPSSIKVKAEHSLLQIKNNHCPHKTANLLEQKYTQALQSKN